MIVPMTKYTFVAYHKNHRDFVESLRELGLVDITTRDWEPNEQDRQLMSEVEARRAAVERLKGMVTEGEQPKAAAFADGEQAYAFFKEKSSAFDSLEAKYATLVKENADSKVWGDFSTDMTAKLAAKGIELRYFSCYIKEFETGKEAWGQEFIVEEISRTSDMVYFIIVSHEGQAVQINAQEMKAPRVSYSDGLKEISSVEAQIATAKSELESCIGSADMIEEARAALASNLQLNKAICGGEESAEGRLIVTEGFIPRESCDKLDAMLEASEVFSIKELPTPEDEVPVLLRNNSFARLFEMIGSFYSLPKYGTIDLTPFFAPFYMLFFGFCLGDGGYGLIFVGAGIYMLLKGGENMRQVAWVTTLCGASTVVFGILTGMFFGVGLGDLNAFAQFRDYFITSDQLFTLAIAIGMVQILFGMVIKVVGICKMYSMKYAFPTIGWIIVLCSLVAGAMLPGMGVEAYSMSSVPFYITLGIGLFMMLFLNSPGKNPLVNLGAGLWNTYNDLTGFMSDILSYIRLFAIGLSGGALAVVFNDLAFGLSPDIPVVKQICVVLILLIGHGINLFMSSLSSFVHPLRLTFVEFYKNAGFEATQRGFSPLKK